MDLSGSHPVLRQPPRASRWPIRDELALSATCVPLLGLALGRHALIPYPAALPSGPMILLPRKTSTLSSSGKKLGAHIGDLVAWAERSLALGPAGRPASLFAGLSVTKLRPPTLPPHRQPLRAVPAGGIVVG